ncbi:hypothetical protein [Pelodictyon luteolum]|uniref:Uncharacterized protein n=1 Tax=Chlorobium luteolum (strain DSM 273 / BCRC 81028 / 2530) TaxID=319225 RepID=Q3B665_CHLL3|nr:hypothetical protein [Pelodictyon luteolum]ABB23166.1 conserved hypothetical protein [Pelodictyon luteolum DSM 273]
MTRSIVACAVDAAESSIVRLKTSGGDGFILTECRTVPAGYALLATPKGQRALKKLSEHAAKWSGEPLSLCIAHDTYHPLPAYFPLDATDEECRGYSRLEASYFLDEPGHYGCDVLPFLEESAGGLQGKKLLMFWPEAPAKGIAGAFSSRHAISGDSTPLKTAVGISKMSEGQTVLLELSGSHVLLVVASCGAISHFSHRRVLNRDETAYFALKEIAEAALPPGTPVQTRGALADRAMVELISRESACPLQPQALPRTVSISGMAQKTLQSPSALNAIMSAILVLA